MCTVTLTGVYCNNELLIMKYSATMNSTDKQLIDVLGMDMCLAGRHSSVKSTDTHQSQSHTLHSYLSVSEMTTITSTDLIVMDRMLSLALY